MTEGEVTGALAGMKIIDLTQMLAGPYATMMLADHGATVIKVESPEGDMTRAIGPFHEDDQEKLLGGYFQSIDRNKKSVCLDLKTAVGQRALKALVADADAIVENFRTGVMERLGLGYEVLREINPRLVYGTLKGFGDPRTGKSPYVDWPAYDVVAQAMGGIMAITGPDADTPTKVGPGVGDIVPGMMLAFGVLAGIYSTRQTGIGQFVDVSMVDAVLAVCERTVWQYSISGDIPGPEGNHHPFLCPFGMFPARDGYVTIAAQQDAFFKTLCEKLGGDHLVQDPRYGNYQDRSANRSDLIPAISTLTKRLTKADLTARLGGTIPFAPVLNIAEICRDPHFTAREMIVPINQPGSDEPVLVAGVPIKLTATPGRVRDRAPYLGEHSEHYLRLAGVEEADIRQLISDMPRAA